MIVADESMPLMRYPPANRYSRRDEYSWKRCCAKRCVADAQVDRGAWRPPDAVWTFRDNLSGFTQSIARTRPV